MNETLPENILNYIKNKKYKTDHIGMSKSSIYIFDDCVLKIENNTSHTQDSINLIKWLKGKIPVPKIIYHEIYNNKSYLLMSKIEGKMSCDDYYLENSDKLLKLISEAFKLIWSIDISDCPINKDIDTKLKEARYRVENNIINKEDFNNEEFKTPEHLLLWLETNKPNFEPVFSHGDFCLPNIFLEGDKIKGFVDLGDAGVSDKWYDIALCYKSLKNNFNGTYGGKIYTNFDPNSLFKVLGIEPNLEKIRYFLLLDELF